MTPSHEHQRARGRAQLVTVAASLLLLALSFATFYRYTSGPIIEKLCTSDGGLPCPASFGTRNAWHGYLGWFGVVLALVAGLCVATAQVIARRTRAHPPRVFSYAALTLYVLATACTVVVSVAIPNLKDLHDIEVTLGGGLHYSDLITDHVAWGYWVSLSVTLIGLAAAAIDVLLLQHDNRLASLIERSSQTL